MFLDMYSPTFLYRNLLVIHIVYNFDNHVIEYRGRRKALLGDNLNYRPHYISGRR